MDIFGPGPRLDEPSGDPARQAVAALRGYAYQLYVSGLAWLALPDGAVLHLEVAEDYAVASGQALAGWQVRDTEASGSLTLQSEWARDTIDSFVDLIIRNPDRDVSLYYLSTSAIGLERKTAHRIDGGPALEYWRRAAAGREIAPLRNLIEALDLKDITKSHLKSLSDQDFRQKFLQRIHWQCGAPGLADVQADLEAGIIEYAASARGLSSHAARDLTPAVLEHVLRAAVSPDKRALRRADLLSLIDKAALVAVPIDQLATAFRGAHAATISRSSQLVPVCDLPLPEFLAPREAIIATINEARRSSGLAIVSGATGLGKSLVARLVAARDSTSWSIADFRHLSSAETASRLARLHGELAAISRPNIILDDLNGIDSPEVRDTLGRLMVSLRRRDGTAIITTYRNPAGTTVHQLTPNASPPIEVPYLDEEEVADLVTKIKGDSKYAGEVYRAAANGHPQLTMAALLHLQESKWSRRAIAATLGGQIHEELDVERRAVRERLVRALPEDAQSLLFRISLVRGGFNRDLAIRIAGLEQAIPRGGLVLDQLVGPWVEPVRRNRLRVSPIIEDSAIDVLSTSECQAVHRCVAEATMMGKDGIEAADAAVAMHHALCSGESELVVAFAHSVIACNVEMIDILAPYLTELMFLPCDKPIFAKDAAAAAMMRLAQLMALTPYGNAQQVICCWEALETERLAVKGDQLFEGLVLSKLLLHSRAGELFESWIDLILRFDRLCLVVPQLSATSTNFRSKADGDPHVTGVLFACQTRNIVSVARFREVMERLDQEDDATRERVFSSFRPGRGDISVLVNHGWLIESRKDEFDWEAAQHNYGVALELAIAWGNTMLASRCAIAQAMCIDENGGDVERALALLQEFESRIGADVAVGRACAKIHWRRKDYASALPLLTAAAKAGGQDQIERAYIAREAGISAATLGDWGAAFGWFDQAHKAAEQASEIPSVRALSIGLLTDSSLAAFRSGRPEIAITRMRDALKTLPNVDPDGVLVEAYCHRIVRHSLLWLYREITGAVIGGDDIVYWPGAASNPEPLEAIRSHPVLDLDMSFYLLADADEALAEPTGFYREFRDHFVVGPVLSSEISAAIADNRKTICSHDPTDFVERIRRHASMSRLVESGAAREMAEKLENPTRGTIPFADIEVGASPDLHRAAEDYLLSFATAAAIARNFDAIDSIVAQGLAAQEIAALHPLLRRMSGEVEDLTSDREGAANAIWLIREDLTDRPAAFCWAAVWLLFHVHSSRLRDGVEAPLIAWVFAGVEHLLRNARFRIATPAITIPAVEHVLAEQDRSLASAAALLIALAPAVATIYVVAVRDRLQMIAQDSE